MTRRRSKTDRQHEAQQWQQRLMALDAVLANLVTACRRELGARFRRYWCPRKDR